MGDRVEEIPRTRGVDYGKPGSLRSEPHEARLSGRDDSKQTLEIGSGHYKGEEEDRRAPAKRRRTGGDSPCATDGAGSGAGG